MNVSSEQMIRSTKLRYPKGTRVELVRMGSDPRPIPEGTRGTVECVDDIGTVHVNWDNGRSLGMVLGEDAIRYVIEADRGEARSNTI